MFDLLNAQEPLRNVLRLFTGPAAAHHHDPGLLLQQTTLHIQKNVFQRLGALSSVSATSPTPQVCKIDLY